MQQTINKHIPAKAVLDNNFGCEILAKRIAIVKPQLHIFGHHHSAYGKLVVNKTISVNASLSNTKDIFDIEHKIENKPIVVNLD